MRERGLRGEPGEEERQDAEVKVDRDVRTFSTPGDLLKQRPDVPTMFPVMLIGVADHPVDERLDGLFYPRQPQQRFKLLAVEPDYEFAVHKRCRGGEHLKLFKFLQRCFIRCNVLFREGNPLLRKPRFLRMAEVSTGLSV